MNKLDSGGHFVTQYIRTFTHPCLHSFCVIYVAYHLWGKFISLCRKGHNLKKNIIMWILWGNIRSMGTPRWREYTVSLSTSISSSTLSRHPDIPGHQQQWNSEGGSNFKEDQSICGGRGGGGGEVRGGGIILHKNENLQSWQLCELIQFRIQR